MTKLSLLTRKMLVFGIYFTLFAAVTTSEDDGSSTCGCSDLLNENCNICAKWKEEGRCEEYYSKIFCKKTCGGCQPDLKKSFIEVSYLGCYNDDRFQREFEAITPQLKREEMNVKNCMEKCSKNGFPYAGLQNGKYCLCSSTYGKYGMADNDNDCSMPCPAGSSVEKCGGPWENAVYEIVKRPVRKGPELSFDEVEKILIHSSIAHNEASLQPQVPVEYPLQLDDLRNKLNIRQ